MATDRSDKVYEQWLAASQQFDYFVTGVSVALVGYLGAAFKASPLEWNASSVELASLVTLLASAFAGLKRVETTTALLKQMQARLYHEEAAGSATAAMLAGGQQYNQSTGQVRSQQELAVERELHLGMVTKLRPVLDDLAGEAGRWYRLRDFLLVLGLLFLIGSRIVAAYITVGA